MWAPGVRPDIGEELRSTRVALALAALIIASPAFAPALDRRPDCLGLAIAIDVSGSTRMHGFDQAREAVIDLLGKLRPCDTFSIIPFAEAKLDLRRWELTAETRDRALGEAAAFVRSLRPGGRKGDRYGHWTNLDEGLDAAMLALLREERTARGVVVLITDGISDPDPNHRPVDLDELARRIPSGPFSLYLIDLSGANVAGLDRAQLSEFAASVKPGRPLVIVPLEAAGMLLDPLSRVEEEERRPPRPEPARPGVALLGVAVAIGITLGVAAFLWRRQWGSHGEATGGRRPRRLLVVRANGNERRFGLPVSVTIGGAESDTICVRGARPRELQLEISGGGTGDFRQSGHRGGLYGSRAFTLSNGVSVVARIERLGLGHPGHRYFLGQGVPP